MYLARVGNRLIALSGVTKSEIVEQEKNDNPTWMIVGYARARPSPPRYLRMALALGLRSYSAAVSYTLWLVLYLPAQWYSRVAADTGRKGKGAACMSFELCKATRPALRK